jgi:hypothetical protein
MCNVPYGCFIESYSPVDHEQVTQQTRECMCENFIQSHLTRCQAQIRQRRKYNTKWHRQGELAINLTQIPVIARNNKHIVSECRKQRILLARFCSQAT